MCLAFLGFFVGIAALLYGLSAARLEWRLPSVPVFWICLVSGFVMAAICLTLIDKPHFALSDETKDWLFMFSAFLGIPLAIPLLAGAAWTLAHQLRNEPVRVTPFILLLFGAFGVGCAASNIHDIVWCGAITHGFTQHYKAGYDLDVFVAFGKWFNIPAETLADYATLGPCAIVLVVGELFVAAVAFARIKRC